MAVQNSHILHQETTTKKQELSDFVLQVVKQLLARHHKPCTPAPTQVPQPDVQHCLNAKDFNHFPDLIPPTAAKPIT